jgi:hypothetical protein
MPADCSAAPDRLQRARKLAVLALLVAVVGLPLNDFYGYLLLVIVVVTLAVGQVTARRGPWAVAAGFAFAALALKFFVAVPPIEEGHNVFLPGGSDNALVTGLPAGVYHEMAAEFDQAFPPVRRCKAETSGCWQSGGRPHRVYAFSFDGLYDNPAFSRRVTCITFSDPVWQRLGFINERDYNWYSGASDINRGVRQRGLGSLLHPWRIPIPYFVMYRFPAAYTGSALCWQGRVLWEQADGRFEPLSHADASCRTLSPGDTGKRIYALAILPQPPLAMRLQPTDVIRAAQLVRPALIAIAAVVLLFLLVQWEPRRLRLPFTLIGLSLVAMTLGDASLLGGVRPFDGGDDGLVYDGWSRLMVQQLLSGDILAALKGMEPVFYFTPGSRYLRAVEHMIFGETYLGYVSLLLWLPFLVLALFRRFLGARWGIAVALMFIAVPVGALFGSTFYLYTKHAAHGYGDPAAAILFLATLLLLIGRAPHGPGERFGPAFGAGLLFALALFVRPNLAIGAAILLGGAGLAALYHRQLRRLTGMCLGFVPVFGMLLHNWYFGGEFVLFSSQTTNPAAVPVPPHTYVTAFGDLLHFDFAAPGLGRVAHHLALVLTGRPRPSSWRRCMRSRSSSCCARCCPAATAAGFASWRRRRSACTRRRRSSSTPNATTCWRGF